MTLPVAVVVPHVHSRREFFSQFCLPSILENDPEEVIIIPNDGRSGKPGVWRNIGFRRTRSAHVIFVDDDTVLAKDALLSMLEALMSSTPNVGYAYGNYSTVVHPGAPWGSGGAPSVTKAIPWNQDALFRSNFISNISLIRSRYFPGYDEELKRLVDWDLWIRMAQKNVRGVWVDKTVFENHQIDESLTAKVPDDQAIFAVRRKNHVWV